jgi:endonuclease G, mitochondrial
LPARMRATLNDCKWSGYDRGHRAPSGGMPDQRSQQDSFSPANIVPQAPCNNQVIWEQIESVVRAYASDGSDVFVITGAIYEGQSVSTIGDGVPVPTRIFKAIHNPQANDAVEVEALSIDALKAITGIDLFASAPESAKTQPMQMPPLPAPEYTCRPR